MSGMIAYLVKLGYHVIHLLQSIVFGNKHDKDLILLTEDDLAAEIDALELGSEANMTPYPNGTSLEVTEMNQDQLCIQVKASRARPLSGERGSRRTYSESEIQVIHEQETPQLHGILKQRSRTLSDSSDEVLSGSFGRQNSTLSGYNGGSESPISESEEFGEDGRKKTVSFSELVDSTLYKTNASIAQLHNTLKNKRKKAKKRDVKKEQKRNNRGRTNSGSSEMSSGDDTSHTDDAEVNSVPDEINGVTQPSEENGVTQEKMLQQLSEARTNKISKKNKGRKGKKKKVPTATLR